MSPLGERCTLDNLPFKLWNVPAGVAESNVSIGLTVAAVVPVPRLRWLHQQTSAQWLKTAKPWAPFLAESLQ